MRARLIALMALAAAVALAFWLLPLRRPQQEPPKRFDPWILETVTPDTEYGTYLGNGYISARVKAEGMGVSQDGHQPCYLAGFYEQESIRPIPTWSALEFYTSEKLSSQSRFTLDLKALYRQTLNMRDGTLETDCVLRNGRWRLRARILLFVSRDRPDLAGLSVSFVSSRTGRLLVTPAPRLPEAAPDWPNARRPGLIWQGVRNKSTGGGAAVLQEIAFSSAEGRPAVLAPPAPAHPWRLDVRRKHRYTILKLVSVRDYAERDWADAGLVRRHLGLFPGVSRFREALESHKAAWHHIWEDRDIAVEGDPEAQQVIHCNLFYLLQSARPEGEWSIAPTGLSSDAWDGQIFWDADTWMFPALALQYPEYARPLLEYRFKTLGQARLNAGAEGCKGASYAWQSALTGREMAPEPFLHGRHVTADVALAQWQYYQLTGDRKWLADRGYPIIRACAEYWASRVVHNPSRGRYEIRRVVGPDENAEIVDNNAYTNAMARKSLETAIAASKLLGKAYPSEWPTVAKAIWIPYDRANDRFIEHEGYSGKKTKQADTELLIFPVGLPMSKKTAANTLDYWSAKVEERHPAMSDSMYAVICCRIGRRDQAYQHFIKSYRPFLRGAFKMFNEKPSPTYDNVCFLTGCGGCLQSVLYGFAGIRYEDGRLRANPMLPSQWRRLTLKGIRFHGRKYDLVVEKGDVWRLKPRATDAKD